MNKPKRLFQLNRRAEFLLDEAEEELHPKKIDRISFVYDNLWERYRTSNKRLQKIQRLLRRTETEASKIIDDLLSSK